MASWAQQMLCQGGGVPGGLPQTGAAQDRLVAGGGCACAGCETLTTQPWPDVNGNLRAFFGCGAEGEGAAENPCLCGEGFEGVQNVFLELDWLPVHHLTPP